MYQVSLKNHKILIHKLKETEDHMAYPPDIAPLNIHKVSLVVYKILTQVKRSWVNPRLSNLRQQILSVARQQQYSVDKISCLRAVLKEILED